jgi:hypothetical protein
MRRIAATCSTSFRVKDKVHNELKNQLFTYYKTIHKFIYLSILTIYIEQPIRQQLIVYRIDEKKILV